MKKCIKCEQEKEEELFVKGENLCKECKSEYNKKYHEKYSIENKEKIKQRQKEYAIKNKEKLSKNKKNMRLKIKKKLKKPKKHITIELKKIKQ